MGHVYRVSYELKYEGLGEWIADQKNVLANGDASRAVAKAQRKALRDNVDDAGKIRRVRKFRLTGVEQITHVDL